MRSIRLIVAMLTGWLCMFSASAENDVQLIGFMEANAEWLDSADPTAAYGFYGSVPQAKADSSLCLRPVPTIHGPIAAAFM